MGSRGSGGHSTPDAAGEPPAQTDAAGRYGIVDLRPGTYAITVTLSGFQTVKRKGIVLTGNFNAQVNADPRRDRLRCRRSR